MPIPSPIVDRPTPFDLALFAEAMHVLGDYGKWPAQKELWSYVKSGTLRFYSLDEAAEARMAELMERYRDTPMDLADASLVVAAERLTIDRIFTLDSHFRIYRIGKSGSFDVVP